MSNSKSFPSLRVFKTRVEQREDGAWEGLIQDSHVTFNEKHGRWCTPEEAKTNKDFQRILANHASNWLHRAENRTENCPEVEAEDLDVESEDNRMLRRDLHVTIDALAEEDPQGFEAFTGTIKEGGTFKEVGQELDVAAKTAWKRTRRAKQFLQDKLADYAPDVEGAARRNQKLKELAQLVKAVKKVEAAEAKKQRIHASLIVREWKSPSNFICPDCNTVYDRQSLWVLRDACDTAKGMQTNPVPSEDAIANFKLGIHSVVARKAEVFPKAKDGLDGPRRVFYSEQMNRMVLVNNDGNITNTC